MEFTDFVKKLPPGPLKDSLTALELLQKTLPSQRYELFKKHIMWIHTILYDPDEHVLRDADIASYIILFCRDVIDDTPPSLGALLKKLESFAAMPDEKNKVLKHKKNHHKK